MLVEQTTSTRSELESGGGKLQETKVKTKVNRKTTREVHRWMKIFQINMLGRVEKSRGRERQRQKFIAL